MNPGANSVGHGVNPVGNPEATDRSAGSGPLSGSTVDVTIIGAGPAGLMAAEQAAAAGASVLLIEAGRLPGRKLLVAGRSGLNLTNTESADRFRRRYGSAAEQLRPILDAFSVDDLRTWASGLGVPTMVGTSGRVFPTAWRAAPLLRAWLAALRAAGVELRTETSWEDIDDDGRVVIRQTDHVETISSRTTVLACGGASWPRTGSTGSWADVLARRGVRSRPFGPANAGLTVAWSDHMRRFLGEPLKNIALTVTSGTSGTSGTVTSGTATSGTSGTATSGTVTSGTVTSGTSGRRSVRGDLVVVGTGLQGTPAYTVSSSVADAIGDDDLVELTIDLLPDLDVETVAERIARRRSGESAANVLRRALRLSPVAIAFVNEFGRAPSLGLDLARHLKAVPLRVTGTEGLDRAISTTGGLPWDALDDQLQIRSMPSLFAAGEMIEWDAPTGGYLLHACLATGAWAGRHAAAAALVGQDRSR